MEYTTTWNTYISSQVDFQITLENLLIFISQIYWYIIRFRSYVDITQVYIGNSETYCIAITGKLTLSTWRFSNSFLSANDLKLILQIYLHLHVTRRRVAFAFIWGQHNIALLILSHNFVEIVHLHASLWSIRWSWCYKSRGGYPCWTITTKISPDFKIVITYGLQQISADSCNSSKTIELFPTMQCKYSIQQFNAHLLIGVERICKQYLYTNQGSCRFGTSQRLIQLMGV